MMIKNRILWIAVVSLASATFLLFQMAMYAAHLFFGLNLSFNLFDLCAVLLHVLGIPYLWDVIRVLVWSTLGMVFWHGMKSIFDTSRAYRHLSSIQHTDFVGKRDEENEGLPEDSMLVAHPAPVAFTIGLFKLYLAAKENSKRRIVSRDFNKHYEWAVGLFDRVSFSH